MDDKIEEYIQKQPSPQKEICQRLRKLIFKTLPHTTEEMKWGVPTFANNKFYIAPLKNHVNLGFLIKGLTKEELALFEGNGKIMRHIKINRLKDIEGSKIAKLLRMVDKKQKGKKTSC